MTREEIKEAAKVMEAYANGKKIQCNDNHLGNGEWVTTDNPSFNWDKYEYRIKPESKYRPFKSQEECWEEMHKHPDFGWVLCDGVYLHLLDVYCNATHTNEQHDGIDYDDALEELTFTDGAPFGIKEE